MLRLLLDEHISPKVAIGLRRRNSALTVHCMSEWESGKFLGQDDTACLLHAAASGLTLVTYDRRSIPPILKVWAEEGRDHGGVIFVDEKTISPADIGGQVKALGRLEKEAGKWDWINRIVFCSGRVSRRLQSV